MEEHALANNQSLQWAYNDLYEREGASDKFFRELCGKSSVAAEDQIIVYLRPQLIKFSSTIHVKDDYRNMGLMGTCSLCDEDLGHRKRPKYSMPGVLLCNFGYPIYVDNLNLEELSVAEHLAVSKARPYAHLALGVANASHLSKSPPSAFFLNKEQHTSFFLWRLGITVATLLLL